MNGKYMKIDISVVDEGVVLTGEGRCVHHQCTVLPVVHMTPVLGSDDGVITETVPGKECFSLGVSKSKKSIVGSNDCWIFALLHQEGPNAIATIVSLHSQKRDLHTGLLWFANN